jgi:hypothetical protein
VRTIAARARRSNDGRGGDGQVMNSTESGNEWWLTCASARSYYACIVGARWGLQTLACIAWFRIVDCEWHFRVNPRLSDGRATRIPLLQRGTRAQ